MKKDSCIALALVWLAQSLSACAGPWPFAGTPDTLGADRQTRHASEASWMAPGASKGDLLYVTDGISNVYVYTYPEGRLVGTLTGFQSPLGECVDPAGDVFVVAQASSSGPAIIYEYAHGGTQPIATLDDPTFGNGCAIDSGSGNLAVSGGYKSGIYSYGDVAIFPRAMGEPTMYYSSTFQPFQLCGYDANGNLYISAKGESGPDRDILVSLPAGSDTFEQLAINVKLYDDYAPSSVQWDGKHVTVSSFVVKHGTYVYRLRFYGSKGRVIGTTTLSSRSNNVRSGQVWIGQRRALASDVYRGKGGIDSWSYPHAQAGRVIVPNKKWDFFPYGIAVSNAVGL